MRKYGSIRCNLDELQDLRGPESEEELSQAVVIDHHRKRQSLSPPTIEDFIVCIGVSIRSLTTPFVRVISIHTVVFRMYMHPV